MTVAIHVDQQRDISCLGASEAPGVLGLDRYNPPIKIWRRHRGMTVNDDGPQEAAYWGTVLEPVIRGKYAHDRQVRVWVPTGSYTMDGWLRCTPDGLVEEMVDAHRVGTIEYDPAGDGYALVVNKLRADGRLGDLQVKTCSAWLEDTWRDGPPAKYEVQCRVELAVADLPWVDIVCLCGGQKQIGPMRIERDKAIEDRILSSLREFWGMVQSGAEPTVDHSDTWRLHVSEKMDRVKPTMIAADNELLLDIAVWRERRVARKRAEQAEAEMKNALLLHLSAAGATRIDCGDRADNVTAYKTKNTWVLRTPSSWKDDHLK
jgi:predicted phage-related endonuclease